MSEQNNGDYGAPRTVRCPADCRIIALDGEWDGEAENAGYRVLSGSTEVGGGTLESWETCTVCEGTGVLSTIMRPKRGRNWHYLGKRYVAHGRGYIATLCGLQPNEWRNGTPHPDRPMCGACVLAAGGTDD